MAILENPEASIASDWEHFVSGLSRAELHIVAGTFKNLDYGARPWLYKRETELINQWVKLDPAAAFTYECETRSKCGDEAFAAWCERDLESALAWILHHDDALLAQTEIVFRKLAGKDFERARSLVLSHTKGGWPIGAVTGLTPTFVKQSGVNGLFDWISQFEDEKLRGSLARYLSQSSLVHYDPAAMLQWIDTQEPKVADQSRGRILTVLGNKTPEAALNYFDSLPSSRQTPESFESAVEGLAGFDPGAADDLIQCYPMLVGPQTFGKLIYHSKLEHPLEALEFASRYEDATKRKQASLGVLRQWRGTDREGYTAWMNSHVIPEDWEKDL